MGFWEHRSVRDQCDLEALKDGTVRDDETPQEEMDRRRLSPRQMAALKAFHSGASLKEAAKAADVTRQTLHRWRTQYHWFAEAMDVWEEGQMIIARSRMVDLAGNAVNTLANAIEDGDARAAMIVLKSLRILRTYGPLKPPAEKMPSAAVLPASDDWPEEASCDTGFQPVVSEPCGAGFQPVVSPRVAQPVVSEPQRVEQHAVTPEQAGRPHHNGHGNGKAPQNGTPARETAATIPVPAKTAPAAQHIDAISNPPVERPKTAILAGKAGSAIKNACYSALQEVTGSYQMLHAIHG